jgi:hypothetical protein
VPEGRFLVLNHRMTLERQRNSIVCNSHQTTIKQITLPQLADIIDIQQSTLSIPTMIYQTTIKQI